jgi:hypothetical protein
MTKKLFGNRRIEVALKRGGTTGRGSSKIHVVDILFLLLRHVSPKNS